MDGRTEEGKQDDKQTGDNHNGESGQKVVVSTRMLVKMIAMAIWPRNTNEDNNSKRNTKPKRSTRPQALFYGGCIFHSRICLGKIDTKGQPWSKDLFETECVQEHRQ